MSAAVALIDTKYPHNVAAAIRACSCYNARHLRWTGSRVSGDAATGGGRLPREERMKGYRDVVWRHAEQTRVLMEFTDVAGYTPVCVEVSKNAEPLDQFVHPSTALYVFGPEDGFVPKGIRAACHRFIYIPAYHCLNLAAAVNVVLYDRYAKATREGTHPELAAPWIRADQDIAVPGWDGK